MVKIGQDAIMCKKKPAGDEVAPVHYNPPASYGLDLEILPLSVLKRRVSAEHLRSPQRIDFHLLICVTEGHCRHMVDFESIACAPGSLLTLRPGQVQRYETTTDWQGWLLMFRPEFLQPKEATSLVSEFEVFHQAEALPVHLALNESEQEAMVESITRMFKDAQLHVGASALHALLRNQLLGILVRLHLIQQRDERAERAAPVHLQRFKRYRLAVEREFHHLHRVAEYAKLLGCSEKSLGRATLAIASVSAKALLSQRVALEAKRLLVHTGLPVSVIADKLGFDEATNFVKFFRREAGCSPGEFRVKNAGR